MVDANCKKTTARLPSWANRPGPLIRNGRNVGPIRVDQPIVSIGLAKDERQVSDSSKALKRLDLSPVGELFHKDGYTGGRFAVCDVMS
jgi:hypothetical protein